MNAPDLFYQNYSVLGGTVFGEAYKSVYVPKKVKPGRGFIVELEFLVLQPFLGHFDAYIIGNNQSTNNEKFEYMHTLCEVVYPHAMWQK
ncbi:MAG: hypothetical protein P8Y16_06275 [Sulfurimonas sp.]